MQVNKGVLTAGVLLMAGFCGGFALSNGSGQILGMKPSPKSSHKHGGAGGPSEEEIAAAVYNAAAPDGGGGEGAGKHPTLNQTGDGGGGAIGSEGGGQPLAGAAGAAAAASLGGGAPVTPLSGAPAAAFLSGNTVDASASKQTPRLIYYAPRGLRAEGQVSRFLVKRWNPTAAQTCEPGSDGVLVCRALEIRREAGEHALGERIGAMLVAGDRWVPIYKGDLIGLPTRIPGIDTTIAEAEPAAVRLKATGRGQAAVDVLVGHVVASEPEPGARRPGTVASFEPDGRVLSLTRPVPGTDLAGGIAVTVGHWAFAQGVFCQGAGASDPVQDCYKPEAWGQTQVRLIPLGKGTGRRFDVVAEAPRSALDVAN